jgi:hypothetical protein
MTTDNENTVTVELDDKHRAGMYDDLVDEFGEYIDADLERVVQERITQLYDNREQLKQQAQEQSAQF